MGTQDQPDNDGDDSITDYQLNQDRAEVSYAARDLSIMYLWDYVFDNNFTQQAVREGVEGLEVSLDNYFYDYMTLCNEDNNKSDPQNYPIIDEENKRKLSSTLARFLMDQDGNFKGGDSSIMVEAVLKELESIGATKQELAYAKYAVQSLEDINNPSLIKILEINNTALQDAIETAPYTPTIESNHTSPEGIHRSPGTRESRKP